jgi:malate dehydrogenase (oxaloacetate-decarboxylating)(NADP+)
MNNNLEIESLEYHSKYPKGKIQINPSKPYNSQKYLSLAYSPGVAYPCQKIQINSNNVYKYTSKGNLVGVITNGSAVLGLGDIGPLASKPVMEGKALLFKIFADINAFDIEISEKNINKFIDIVKAISPTFGGINLEDIKSPEAFEIEHKLKKQLNIPIMHDDQHGTAIISGAALINALYLINKNIKNIKIVFNGAGSAAISCAKIYHKLGVDKENIIMCDSKGVLDISRDNINKEKKIFLHKNTKIKTLEHAIKNADVFVGLSIGNVLTPQMLKSMNNKPIVFAMANPIPEINYNVAKQTRKDIIIATGRSDYPNQVNNVLGFPYIFRGALDVQSTNINENMKIAAVHAIASIARESIPEYIKYIYRDKIKEFNENYIIPTPFDNRLITEVSTAVAKAAIKSNIAQKIIYNWTDYKNNLKNRIKQYQHYDM